MSTNLASSNYAEDWVSWRTGLVCSPSCKTDDGEGTVSMPMTAYAESFQDAKNTAMIHFGWALQQRGVEVLWLK